MEQQGKTMTSKGWQRKSRIIKNEERQRTRKAKQGQAKKITRTSKYHTLTRKEMQRKSRNKQGKTKKQTKYTRKIYKKDKGMQGYAMGGNENNDKQRQQKEAARKSKEQQ